jgi:hypothetical protein
MYRTSAWTQLNTLYCVDSLHTQAAVLHPFTGHGSSPGSTARIAAGSMAGMAVSRWGLIQAPYVQGAIMDNLPHTPAQWHNRYRPQVPMMNLSRLL